MFKMTRDRMSCDSEWPGWVKESWEKEPDEDGALVPVYAGRGIDRLAVVSSLPVSDGRDCIHVRGLFVINDGENIFRKINGGAYVYAFPRMFLWKAFDFLCQNLLPVPEEMPVIDVALATDDMSVMIVGITKKGERKEHRVHHGSAIDF